MTVEAKGDTPTPDTTPEQAALLAMDAGVNDQPMPEAPAAPAPGSPEARAAEVKPAEGDILGDEKPAETPSDAVSDKDKPADKPKDEKPAEEAKKPADDAEAAKEADSLGLKDKARERFFNLTSELKASAPFREAAEKIGIKSPEQLADLADRAKVAVEMVDMVRSTGATPQQYDMALGYLEQVNKAINGDTKAATQVWGWLMEELKTVAPIVGKEVPGIVDPLAEHPDLQKEVDTGDITRSRALEIAQQRATSKAREDAEARKREHEQQGRQTEAQQAQAVEAGKAALTALGNELAKQDPTAYQAKFPMLAHIVKTEIVPNFPPQQWEAKAALAWAKLAAMPAPAAAPAKATPAPSPVRPGGINPNAVPEFADPMQALNAALDLPD